MMVENVNVYRDIKLLEYCISETGYNLWTTMQLNNHPYT